MSLKLTCTVCNDYACNCNGKKCECGFTVYQLYETQNLDTSTTDTSSEEIITTDTIQTTTANTGIHKFDGAGIRSQCIYCKQYKFYTQSTPVCKGSQ